jgi:hypothetical protein
MVLATLSQIGDFAKISYNHSINYVTKLTGYDYEYSGAGDVKLEFRWSTTNQIKTAWIDLTNENLVDVKLDPNNDLWIDFRVTLVSGGPVMVNAIGVKYEQDPIAKDKFLGFKPIATACQCGNITSLTKIENFTFRPYQVNPAVSLFRDLSYTVNQLFGHSVEYARAIPLMNGRDVTLKEWTLYDVDDPCCIKVLVPNNEFPDNKINFGAMGLDFEMPFEVHIPKDYFEDIFGVGSGPQKRDIVYFPITNRIYEVQSSYLFRDFMQKPVYWKVALMKYAPKSNRTETQDHRYFLDSISVDTEEVFGQQIEDEALETTKPQQYDPKIGSRAYDPIRDSIDDALTITSADVKNYYTVVSNSQYNLNSIYDVTEQKNAVVYKSDVDFGITDNRAFLAWFKDETPKYTVYRDLVQSNFTVVTANAEYALVQFNIAASRNYKPGDYIKFSRPNGILFYGEWVSSPASGVHRVNLPIAVYNFLQAQHSGWQSAGSFYAEQTFEKNIFWGYDPINSKGWKLDLVVGKYIKLFLNNTVHYFVMPTTLAPNEWYAIFVNLSNEYSQVSINIWKRKWIENDPTPQNTTDLENIYAIAKQVTAADYSTISADWRKYRLIGTPLSITNIRLFDSLENDTEKQMTLLNEAIVEDAQLAIIIDNALPRLRLPWIAKTK